MNKIPSTLQVKFSFSIPFFLMIMNMIFSSYSFGEITVQVNQLGYTINFPKRFVVMNTTRPTQAGLYEIISGTSIIQQGTLTPTPSPENWNDFYMTGEFTNLNTPGTYQIRATYGSEIDTSFNFKIDSAIHIYGPALEASMGWFKLHRCGFNNELNHHIWDATLPNPFGLPFDARGGWHDADDLNVYMGYLEDMNFMVSSCTPGAAYMMLNVYEDLKSFFDKWDKDNNQKPDILEEVIWGLDWLVRFKPQAQTGGAWYKMKQDGWQYRNEERRVRNNWSGKPYASIRGGAGMAIAALSMATRLNITQSAFFTASDYWNAAELAWTWYANNNADSAADNGVENLLDHIGWTLAGLEMYKTTFDQQYLVKARASLDKILTAQTGDAIYTGWFNRGDGGPLWSATDEGTIIHCLMEYSRSFPTDTVRNNIIRDVVKKYMDFKLTLTNKLNNPYGLVRTYFKHRDSIAWGEQYFMPHTEYTPGSMDWYQGENAKILSNSWAALCSNEFLNSSDYNKFAMDQLNWIYGVNVQNVSFQKGLGSLNPPYFKNAGTLGAIPNGFIGGGSGEGAPFYAVSGNPAVDWRVSEEAIYHLYMSIAALSKLIKVSNQPMTGVLDQKLLPIKKLIDQTKSFKLFDLNGRLLKTFTNNSKAWEVHIPNFLDQRSGVFLLTYERGSMKVIGQKPVIRN